MITIIAAIGLNSELGKDNDLIWHLPADLKRFKKVTSGHHILMGRNTFESIGKPLPGRTNIVLTRNADIKFEGVECVSSFEQALALVADVEEVMVIGGSTIYEMLLPQVNRLYFTYVDAEFDGDAWFPEFDVNQWYEIESVIRKADEKNRYDCRFVTLERK